MAFFVFHTWIISERLFQCTHLISCRLRNILTNSVQIRKESDMKGVVIVSVCRTAIGIFGGALKHAGREKIACETMKEAIDRAGIEPLNGAK